MSTGYVTHVVTDVIEKFSEFIKSCVFSSVSTFRPVDFWIIKQHVGEQYYMVRNTQKEKNRVDRAPQEFHPPGTTPPTGRKVSASQTSRTELVYTVPFQFAEFQS